MKLERLSIFMPLDTAFYRAVLEQMRRGFEAEGVQTTGSCGLLNVDDMTAWCQTYRPQAILEMNRTRVDAPSVPPDVKHLAWIVDFNGKPLEHFAGSDVTYLFGVTWPARYPHKGLHRWFGPGACETDYTADSSLQLDVDAMFAGYIPWPWSPAELGRDLSGGRGTLTFAELLPDFEGRLRAARGRIRTADDFLAIAEDVGAKRGASPLVLDDRLRADICTRVIRQLNRRDLIDATLGYTRSLAIYGPPKWNAWPAYAQFYRGFIEDPQALRRSYQTAAASLHEGNGIHFRSMDCMCAGGLLFFRETVHDRTPGGIRSFFEPHVHYVPFTLDTLADELRTYLGDPARMRRVRTAAAAEIRQRHTWRHRAREVLDDLRSL